MKTKGKVIAVVNQKGGVTKTTTTFNLAYSLARKGKKVCMIDFDPQSNLTMLFGIDKPDELEMTIYDLLMQNLEDEELPEISKYIISRNGVDLIPSCIELSVAEINLVNAMSREFILKNIMESIRDSYDYIIIDCMPALGMLTLNALVACDSILITATAEYLSAKGLELLIKTIFKVKRRLNPVLVIEGILVTMYVGRTNLSKDIVKLIEEAYEGGIRMFETKIPRSTKVGEANLNSKSIFEYMPKNNVSLAYESFVEELLENE